MTRFRRLLTAALLLWPTLALAQGGSTNIRATDPSTGQTTQVGNIANNALRVTLVGTNSIRIQDGSGNPLTSLSAGAQRAITVAVVDSSGNQVSSFGGAGGTASNFTSAFPAAGTAIGFSDGTNMQASRVFDADTGGGTQYVQGLSIRISGSGGSIEAKGQQTMANSLPIVIASDQSALPVSQSGGWSVRAQDGSGNNLTSLSVGAQRAITVAIVDGSGTQITSFGGAGGTASNFGSAFPTPGTAAGFTDGTNMQGARVVDADTGAGTYYALTTNLVRRTSGTPTELIGQTTMSGSIPVAIASDQTALSASISALTPGTGATNSGKAEDAAHTTGDVGSMALAVRQSTNTDLSAGATNGDYEPLQVDATGRLWTNTEMPDAATLSNGTSNPTVPGVASFLMSYNGTTWDRAQLATDATHDSAVLATGPQIQLESKDFDGAALTTVSAEGDATRAAGSLFGVLYNMWVTEDGSKQIAKLEDAAHADADAGVPIWTRRRDTAAASSGTEGDYQTLDTDGLGRLWVRTGDPCADPARVTSKNVDTAASGNVELVALQSGQVVYVCGYSLVASGAVATQFIYGTGTACATGETDLTGPWSFAANGGIAQTNAGSVQFKTASANALCIENSAAVQVSGHVTYVQTAAP